MKTPQTIHQNWGLPMNRIARKESKSQAKSAAQKARRREYVVKKALKKGNAFAAWAFGEPPSNDKRWRKRYDGTWQSLLDRSHRPLTPHPNQHTPEEETLIRKAFKEKFFRWGWPGVYDELVDNQCYTRGYWGMRKAAARMELTGEEAPKKPARKHDRRFPELKKPGEKSSGQTALNMI